MKTITIHSHPEYWGDETTDTEAGRFASQMAECAEKAGFKFDCTDADGTTDAADCYSHDYQPDAEDEEVDWFSRWCSHGFRGMVAWLKRQL